MSGYDIKKHVQSTMVAVGSASYGTLYPTLHKLLADQAVEVEEIPQQGRPARKEYRITGRGREELLGWLQQPPVDDRVQREFLLKLYLGRHLTGDEMLGLIMARRGQMEAGVRSLQADHSAADDPRQVWLIEYALAMYQAELEWLAQIEHQIRQASW